MNEPWKTLKLKEKNIHDTFKKSDMLDETCKRRKEAISSLKQEQKELEKKLKKSLEEIPFWLRRETWAPLIENLQGSI